MKCFLFLPKDSLQDGKKVLKLNTILLLKLCMIFFYRLYIYLLLFQFAFTCRPTFTFNIRPVFNIKKIFTFILKYNKYHIL